MAAELKARRNMDPKFMWDLKHIYPSKEAWEAACAELKAEIPGLDRFTGTLGTARGAKEALDSLYKTIEKATLIWTVLWSCYHNVKVSRVVLNRLCVYSNDGICFKFLGFFDYTLVN